MFLSAKNANNASSFGDGIYFCVICVFRGHIHQWLWGVIPNRFARAVKQACWAQFLVSVCYKFFITRYFDMKRTVLFITLFAPIVVNGSVYKWVDENGKVHYGDQPQAKTPAVEVDIDDSAPVSSGNDDRLSRAEKRERLLQSMEEDRVEKQEQREKQKALNEQNRKKCNRYRDRMRHYQRASGLYRLDNNGNRVYMSDADRSRATKNLQAKIKKYCR